MGETEVLGDKPVPVPRYSTQLSHGLAWNWARAYAMTGQQLAASAMHGQLAIGPLKYAANSNVQRVK